MRSSIDNGSGLFARSPGIKAGTVVLSEAPMVITELAKPIEIYDAIRRTLNNTTPGSSGRSAFKELHGVGDQPSRPPGARMPDLSNGPGQIADTRTQAYRMSLMPAKIFDRYGPHTKMHVCIDYIEIFENNCFKIHNLQNTGDASAVFKW